MKCEEYKAKNGDAISLIQNGPNYMVECWDHEDKSRWLKSYRDETEARKEFERWRS